MSGKLNSELRDQLRAFALDTLYWPNRAKKIVEKQDFFHSVANDIGISEELLYLEFGVAHGKSLTEIAKLFINSNSRFIGFDSFTGLPEDWLMHEKGAFSNQGRPPSIEDDRIQFIQGWYQNTVPLHL